MPLLGYWGVPRPGRQLPALFKVPIILPWLAADQGNVQAREELEKMGALGRH
jgi:hypothetical protein